MCISMVLHVKISRFGLLLNYLYTHNHHILPLVFGSIYLCYFFTMNLLNPTQKAGRETLAMA